MTDHHMISISVEHTVHVIQDCLTDLKDLNKHPVGHRRLLASLDRLLWIRREAAALYDQINVDTTRAILKEKVG